MDPRAQTRLLPQAPGVYRFLDGQGRTLYIGRATNLRARAGSYLTSTRDRPRLRRMVVQIAEVQALVCQSVHEACWLERNLHHRSLPRWNRARGGEEVELYVQVTPDPGRPGVKVVHERGHDTYGPFLGSTRIRLGVQGLNRASPLWLTGTRLTASERDLAAARGVTPADHERLLTEVTALLSRDPVATEVTADRLVTHRDHAVAAERFEVAQQVHDELDGLRWLTAPQRVALDDLGKTAATATVGDLTLRLGAHAGRLDEWRLVHGPVRALPHHPALTALAEENVALAARLRG